MERLVFLLSTGLARGAVLALFALSLVIVYRAARAVNFAQAAMAVVPVYVALAVTSAGGSFWLGLAVALAVGALLGAVVERGLLRLVPQETPLPGIIVAVGLVMVLQAGLAMVFGPDHRPVHAPFSQRPFDVGGVSVLSPYDLFVLVVAAVVMGGLALLFSRTSLGLRLRAAAFAPETSRLLGVRVPRMVTLGWMLSSATAALAALLLVPTGLGLDPHAADVLFVNAFAAAVVGGLDSPVGALVAGLAVGVLVTLVTGYASAAAAPLAVLVLLTAVLLVRPHGLFATREARTA
ncbi:branched-chain amino acid ABC transporter permease [Promicromonospora citrea]|uniref:Branched-chain amino acid ABC transporter permease n=1 Tax=Promicromonospora citrea TaxID=43677 RepID=A0A8H9GK21_9MICO|nr:branched-chain amino acid ABC transporter permease [Promicromonospora citrea]NNH53243.1 branched-chain amino acid ABC transporter permease [Promicromonospora citrea]GGM34803.1 branched-chain amino acid ABC transporter permease [Promicromonospora citrea]HEV6951618.1 branched-chain amino acid ABC transporter permease [Promicromonospora sp.]